MIVPVIGYSQVVAKEENGAIKAGNTVVQSTIKNPSPQEIQRQRNFNLEELKVRWKKAALENCTGVPCVVTPPAPSFTCGTNTVTDVDGNIYNTVAIGTGATFQCWMKENLKVTKYRDNTVITLDASGGVNGTTGGETWSGQPLGARTVYLNDVDFLFTYGYLYNWFAVNEPKGLCPTGWHVPTNAEWTTLIDHLGGISVAGGRMKATTLWNAPNTGATNDSGFFGFPGGIRNVNGSFNDFGNFAFFWSASVYESNPSNAWSSRLNTFGGDAGIVTNSKIMGASVRCLRD